MSEVVIAKLDEVIQKGEKNKEALEQKFSQEVEGVKSEVKVVKDATDKLAEKYQEIETTQKEILKKQGKLRVEANQNKSYSEALNDALVEKQAEIESIVNSGGKQNGPLVLNVKAAVTMSAEGTIGAVGSASHLLLTHNTGIVSTLRKRVLTYLNNVSVGSISPSRPYAMWVEELDEQGTPIFIGEGDAKTQLSVRYEEREKRAKKIGVYGKVTTEMMRYLPQLISYIQNNLLKRMDIKTEDQLFDGDDTGDNLKGLISYATAFDGGVGTSVSEGLVGKVSNPTNSDVIRAIALQVQNSYGTPNAVFVKNDILAEMDCEKGDDGHYVIPPFKTADGTQVAGVRLIPTTALVGTDYDFVGGDLSVVNVQFTDQSSVQIGLDGNDFTNNKKTILVEQELVQYVSANDTQVLVKGTFAAAKALIIKNEVPEA
jgi:HK97 family phage major capsid protein